MDTSQTHRTHSSGETQELARTLAVDLVSNPLPQVVCLYGELGSGKTTFTQGFAKGLGLIERIISPTFLFVREYELSLGKMFYHLDVYRMNTDDPTVGISEILSYPNAIILIEWADRIKDKLPKQRIDVYFEHNDDGSRTITIC